MESETHILKTPHETVQEENPHSDEITHGYEDLLHDLNIEGFHEEADPQVTECFQKTYEAFLEASDERIIGSGNHAIVFDLIKGPEANALCAKGLWSPGLSVACRNKARGILPAKYERLRTIQEYYEMIAQKKREFIARGVEFNPQAGPVDEALITNIANAISTHDGHGEMVPFVEMIIEHEREDVGKANDKANSTFMVQDNVTFLVMTKVHGITIEQAVLEKSNAALLNKIDFASFKTKILNLIASLHQRGIYHNDISTRNIMIDRGGNPYLIDFGAGTGQGVNDDSYRRNIDQAEQTLKILEQAQIEPDTTRELLEERIGL